MKDKKLPIGLGNTCTEIARKMGVTTAAVSTWKRRGRIPPARVAEFCKLTGARPEDVNPIFKGFRL